MEGTYLQPQASSHNQEPGTIVMKSAIKITIITSAFLPIFAGQIGPTWAQTCGSDQSQPMIIYRNAGPPIIIENAFNPCREAEKKALKLQRKREKLAKRLSSSEETDVKEIKIDLRP